jgi:type II secretory pathway pseudopilin PulG
MQPQQQAMPQRRRPLLRRPAVLNNHVRPRPTTRRLAFSLIELILALGLSVVLLSLLASAMSLGMSRATVSRQRVEQARLVEGVVSLIRNDVHRGVIYNPQDTSTAMQLAEAMADFNVDSLDSLGAGGSGGAGGGGAAGGGGSGGGGGAGAGGGSGGGGGAGGSAASEMESTQQEPPLRQPLGLYGNLQELQIDVLRERPSFEIDSTGAIVAPTAVSGITTVRYTLGQGTATLGLAGPNTSGGMGNGLVRQEVNRDILNWATQMGSGATVAGNPKLIAPEVSRMEFRYFDGTTLLETWDTYAMQGQLPQAIELRIWFVETFTSNIDGSESTEETPPYVITIALPATWNYLSNSIAGAGAGTGSTTGSGTTSATSGGSTSGGSQ